MSADDDPAEDCPSTVWDDRPVLTLTPSRTELTPSRVADSLKRWYRILDTDDVLDWRVVVEDGECRYSVCAPEHVLDQLEPTLRQALPDYAIERTAPHPPAVDATDSPVGVRFEGHSDRTDDWQTGLRPHLTGDDETTDARSALTAAVDALADTDATVVYQALVTPNPHWEHLAISRRRRLESNRDTFWMRFVDDYVVAPGPDRDVTPDPEHAERIKRIDAVDTAHSFEVAARALAYGPDAEAALQKFESAFASADGPFYRVGPTRVDDPLKLKAEMADQTIPSLSWWARGVRRLFGAGARPSLVADPRTLGQFTLVDGAELTDAGKRLLATTPDERTTLADPDPEVLSQYDDGFTLGRRQQRSTSTDSQRPATVAVPPSMQRMHMLIIGKSGSGKSTQLIQGALDNHVATEGPSILIDGKGDGLPREYMQAHYARFGTLENVLHFDCSEVVPALSFFDVRPYLDNGTARVMAIEDIADHYIELLRAMMGPKRFDQAIQSPAVIRYLVKALFDPVHGSDAFAHRDLQRAAVRMKATEDAPPVTDAELEEMLSGVVSNTTQTFEMVMGGVESRINTIPGDSRLSQLFNHVPEDGDPHFDFYDHLDEDTVILFDTSSLRSNAQQAMTLVLLSNLWTALKRRANDRDDADRTLVNLYLEEAARVASSGLVTELLAQSRGFGLSMTLSMQFPEQLRAANPRAYAEVLNNVSTVVSGNVSVDSDLTTRFATADLSPHDAGNRLRALKRGEWLVSLPSEFGTPEPRPFTLDSTPLPDGLSGSDRPLTPAMRAAFEAKAQLTGDDTRTQYGIDVTVHRASYTAGDESTSSSATAPGPNEEHQRHVLEHTKRLPEGIEWAPAHTAFVCTHCDARYEQTRIGMLRAVDCCYGLDRLDRDDVPLCSLTHKLSEKEATATGYSSQQLYFLQAVYDAHQQRFDAEWEYDIVSDSMVRLQEYTGIDPAAITELIDDDLLVHDGDYPQKFYTVTPAGRHLLNEPHKRGVAHGDGAGDLGESSLHVAMVEVGRRFIEAHYVNNPDSQVVTARTYHNLEDGTRLDAVGLDAEGTELITFEAERVNNDILEAVPSDFDKMANCTPTDAIWLTENRAGAHAVLQALNDPKHGPPRVETTYNDSYQPQRITLDTPGLTAIHTFRYMRDTLLTDSK
jgi:hypothetical protein